MIDTDRLATWMDETGLPGKGEPIEHRYVTPVARRTRYTRSAAESSTGLCESHRLAPESRDEGMLREWRIIEALDGSDVPHTRAIAMCADKSVLGRPFYMMGFVDGWSPMNTDGWPAPSTRTSRPERASPTS